MMNEALKNDRIQNTSIKRYRFVFDLAGGVLYGGFLDVLARTKKGAWLILRSSMPGAEHHVKTLTVFNFS